MSNYPISQNLNNLMIDSKRKTDQSPDYIYYNINISNKDDISGKELKFSENRTVPVVDNPSNYKMACVRLLVPSINIPLMFFPSENFFVKLSYN